MESNDFSLSSGSDFKVSEMEDYELEVKGSPTCVLRSEMRKARFFCLWNNIQVKSQLLHLQEHTVGLASDNEQKMKETFTINERKTSLFWRQKTDWCWEIDHLSFASLTFRFIDSVVAQNTTRVHGLKITNADSNSLQPPLTRSSANRLV